MCLYSDMDVQLCSACTIQRIPEDERGNTNFCNLSNFQMNFRKFFDTFRLWLLIFLFVNPASGVPIYRRRNLRSDPSAYLGSYSDTELPREGIGIVLNTQESSTLHSSPIPISSYPTSANLNNNLEGTESVPLKPLSQSQLINNLVNNIKNKDSLTVRTTQLSDVFVQPSTIQGGKNTPQRTTIVTTLEPVSTQYSESGDIVSSTESESLHKKSVKLRAVVEMSGEDESTSGRNRRAPTAGPGTCGGDSGRDAVSNGADWMEPCRNHNLMADGDSTPAELSHHILKAIVEANSQVEGFINNFSEESFGVSWADAAEYHEEQTLAFLNTTGEVDLQNLEILTFESALQESYELMQRRAVGIEQVTLDQALYQSSCLSRFRQVEMRIIHILCQMRHAMLQLNTTTRENITGDIMTERQRSVTGDSARNKRDAIILREYMSSLRLLHSVFNHFQSNV